MRTSTGSEGVVPCRAARRAALLVALVAAVLFCGVAAARICGDNTYPWPNCGGDCFPPPFTICVNDSSGAPVCNCEPPPCDWAFAQTCDGPCPDPGQECIPNAAGGCRCDPISSCEDSAYPGCNGCCGADEVCVPQQVAGAASCACEPIACELSVGPTCGGVCAGPQPQTCVFNTATSHCECDPPPLPCNQTMAPACNGDCAPGETCVDDQSGTGHCNCAPTPCAQSPHPTCDGACPPGSQCLKDPTGVAACACEPIRCEDLPMGAVCNGACATTAQACIFNAAVGCVCDPPVACADSPLPGCAGACPVAGDTCVFDPLSTHCLCEPPTPCAQSPYPACSGDCPAGEACVRDTAGTGVCDCEPIACELTTGPTCGGTCPNSAQTCVFVDSLDECRCTPPVTSCEEGPYPGCNGCCTDPNTTCVPNPDGTPDCICEPIPCKQSPYPDCEGVCPIGQHCVADSVGGGDCRCEPTPCELSDPLTPCDGPCQFSDQTCETNAAGDCRCERPVLCEMSLDFPLCDAPCPNAGDECVRGEDANGLPACVCEPISCPAADPFDPVAPCNADCPLPGQNCVHNTATGKCNCTPPPTECEDLPIGVQCNGPCDDTSQICVQGAAGCDCVPRPCEHDDTPYPECIGICPPGEHCLPDTTGLAQCTCQPDDDVPCEQQFPGIPPVCDGPCQDPTQTCEYNAIQERCQCQPTDLCEQAPYDDCDAPCPPGEVCVPDPTSPTPHCRCVPEPCEQTMPTCDGACPFPGQECIQVWKGGNLHVCRCTHVTCQNSPYPTCNGICPGNEQCVPRNGVCTCEPILPPPCGQTFPTCNGFCPVGSACRSGFVGGCFCCSTIGPPTDDIIIHMGAAKSKVGWTPHPCAGWYNVYRATLTVFTDADDDGMADPDNYGECLAHDVPVTEIDDLDTPAPGSMNIYLVTAENEFGESSKGYPKPEAGQPRPNIFPCP